jgi:hypothetical protein
MITDGLALWGEQGLTTEQVEARIAAVPLMIEALQNILTANLADTEQESHASHLIVRALNAAGV